MPPLAIAEPRQYEYICSECSVIAKRISGKPFETLPSGWVTNDTGTFCLSCDQRRIKNLARTGDPEARAAVVELVERQLIRRPAAHAKDIALALGVSRQIVTGTRQRLIGEGRIEDQTNANKPAADRTIERAAIKAKVEEALRENSARPNSEIARCTGSSANTVRRCREAMSIPAHDPHADRLRLAATTLGNLGPSTIKTYAKATQSNYGDARTRLEGLAKAGLAKKSRSNGGKVGSDSYTFTLIDAEATHTVTQPAQSG